MNASGLQLILCSLKPPPFTPIQSCRKELKFARLICTKVVRLHIICSLSHNSGQGRSHTQTTYTSNIPERNENLK